MVDIFAGSNTTGQVAEAEGRRWIAFEEKREYVATSAFRFADTRSKESLKALYEKILTGVLVDIDTSHFQPLLPLEASQAS